ASAKQAPVKEFFKSAHEDAWRAHLAKIARKSSAPSWIKSGYKGGKFKSSIWSYIPSVVAEYAIEKNSLFRSTKWVSLDNLDEQLQNENPKLEDVYTMYSGSNWNAFVFRNLMLNALRNDVGWFKKEQKAFGQKQVGEDFLTGMVDCLKTYDELKGFSSELDRALADIKIYARDLQLYDYFQSVKEIIWKGDYRKALRQTADDPAVVSGLDIAPGMKGSFYFDKTGGHDTLCGFVEFEDFKFRKPSPKNKKEGITLNNGTLRRYFIGERSEFIVDYCKKAKWKKMCDKSKKSDGSDNFSGNSEDFDAKIAFLPVNDEFGCDCEKKLDTSDYFGIKFEKGEELSKKIANVSDLFKKFCNEISININNVSRNSEELEEYEQNKKQAQEEINRFERRLKWDNECIEVVDLTCESWKKTLTRYNNIFLNNEEYLDIKEESEGKRLTLINEVRDELKTKNVPERFAKIGGRSYENWGVLFLTKAYLGYIDDVQKRLDADIKRCDDKKFLDELLTKFSLDYLLYIDKTVVDGNMSSEDFECIDNDVQDNKKDEASKMKKLFGKMDNILKKVYEFYEKRKEYISKSISDNNVYDVSSYDERSQFSISSMKNVFSKSAKKHFDNIVEKEREKLQTALLDLDKYDQLGGLRSSLSKFRNKIGLEGLSGLLRFETQIPQDAEIIKQPAQSMEEVEKQLEIFKDYKKRISNLMSLRIKLGSTISEPDAYKVIGWHLKKPETKKKK
ncbi:MAG: hypothetical protein IJ599_01810, partial [Alphaproteobacteria bacterium]|nr:hypothetical protein [Alphaproteobacteria bacterium]